MFKKYIIFIAILILVLPVYSQINKGIERSTPVSEVNFKWLDSRAASIDNNVIVKTITYTDSLADSVAVDSFFLYIGDATKIFSIMMIDTTGRTSTGIRPWVSVQVNDVILVDTNFYYLYTNDVLQPFTTIVDTNDIANMTGQYNKFYANVLTTGNDTLTDYLGVKVQVQDGGRGSGGLASRQIKYVLQFIAVLDQRLDEENITSFLLKSAFGDSLNNEHTITSVWNFTGDSVTIEHLVADTIRVDSIYVTGNARIDGTLFIDSAIVDYAEVRHLVADSIFVDTVFADYINVAETIVTDSIYVSGGARVDGALYIDTAIVDYAEVIYLRADSIFADTIFADYINAAETIITTNITAGLVNADTIYGVDSAYGVLWHGIEGRFDSVNATVINAIFARLDTLEADSIYSAVNVSLISTADLLLAFEIRVDSIFVDTIFVDYINVAENIILNGVNITDSLTNILDDSLLLYVLKTAFGDSLNNIHTITGAWNITGDWIFDGQYVFNDTTYFNSELMLDSINLIDSVVNIIDDTMVVLRNNMVDSAASTIADTLTDLLSRIQEITGAYWKFSRIDVDTLMGADSIYGALINGSEGRFDSTNAARTNADSIFATGIVDHNNPHAYLNALDSSLTIAADVNVWYHLTNSTGTFFNEEEVDGITVTGDSMIVVKEGDYQGDVSISITSAAGNKVFEIRIAVNGIARVKGVFGAPVAAEAAGRSLPIYLVDLSTGDVISFQIRGITDGTDPTIIDASWALYWFHYFN